MGCPKENTRMTTPLIKFAAAWVVIVTCLLAACSPIVSSASTIQEAEITAIPIPTSTAAAKPEKIVSVGTPARTEIEDHSTAEAVEKNIPSARGGYVVFSQESGEFIAYRPDGTAAYTIPAAGIKYPSSFNTSVVDGAVYYLPDNSEKFVRAAPNEIKVLDIPTNSMSRIDVSADEKYIAWSLFNTNGSSALWAARMDENQNILEQREVAHYSFEQSNAFNLTPIDWTDDSQLLFERGLTGIGGYILYGGYNSLYRYNPEDGTLTTLIPAEENHGLCLENYRPDLAKVLFNCSRDGREIIIRDLNSYSDQKIPTLPGQGAAGSAHLSPSGRRLAYAVARNNPDNESGEVVVVTTDLSTAPAAIAKVTDNSYPVVLGWLNEDTLLFASSRWPEAAIWSIRYDGSQLEKVTDGWFIGWIR